VVMSIEHYEALALNREITEALAAAEVEMETTTERFTTADIRADLDELLAARATEQSQSA